jgi:Carboxypeptidase regulatory-like domain/Pectate lyase superfamily protein
MLAVSSKLIRIAFDLALVSSICFLSSIPVSARVSSSNKTHYHQLRDTNEVSVVVNLRDYGAIGDGVADDGPALQLALNDLAGGGTLQVPAGKYLIVTPVLKQFSSDAALVIEGAPSSTPIIVGGNGLGLNLSSEFVVAVGETKDALTLRGLDSLLMKDVGFTGVEEVINDAHKVLVLSQIKNATVQHCEFYGLASLVEGGAIVAADLTDLRLEQSAFLGCATNSGVRTSVVQNSAWLGVSVRDCKFVDYGNRPFFSKTPLAAPYSWISVGDPFRLEPAWSSREAILDNVFMDEGGWLAVSVRPDLFATTYPPFDVYMSRLYVNVNNLGSSGLYIYGTQRLFIDRSHLGWSHRAGPAIVLSNVGDAILDLIDCSDDATRIVAAAQRLTVINSVYTSLDSTGPVTRVITTDTPEEDPAQYVRNQYVEVLNHDPDAAGHYYWSDKILRCEANGECETQAKNALAAFLASAPPAKFSAYGRVVDEDGAPLAGVRMSLTGSQSIQMETDADGNFAFNKLATAGNYELTPVKNHYTFANRQLLTPTSDQQTNFTGTLLRHTISGRVFANSVQALAGATLTLSGGQTGSTTTDDEGHYSFPNLAGGGSYVISVSHANYIFDPVSRSISDLSADQIFDFQRTVMKYTISGHVMKSDGTPLNNSLVSGVTTSVTGSVTVSVLTDNSGAYSFTLPGESDYTITAAELNYTFNPASISVHSLSANQSMDFSATLNPGVPILLTTSDPARALAFDAVLRTTEPFDLNYDYSWSQDRRTRIVLYAGNFPLLADASLENFAVEIEDASHRVYPLTVEYVGAVQETETVRRIVVRLSDDLTDVGDVLVRVAYLGAFSEPLRIGIGHLGGAPPN